MARDWTAYTDGACKGNPGPAGWGLVLFTDDGMAPIEAFGAMPDYPSTNQRAELYAAIQAIREAIARSGRSITICTDSMYVISLVQGGGQANADLVSILRNLQSQIAVRTVKVKAHSGIVHNERADQLAVSGAQRAMDAAPQETANAPVDLFGQTDALDPVRAAGLRVERKSQWHYHVRPANGGPVLNYYPTKKKLYSTALGTLENIDLPRLIEIAKGRIAA